MILYIIIILICMFLIILANSIFGSICMLEHGLLGLSLIVCFGVAIEFIIDLIISALVYVFPIKCYKPFQKTYKWEKKFYDKLKIKSWKEKIPVGKGPLGLGINKNSLENTNDLSYLQKFIDECVRAEVMHFVSMFVGFVIIIILPLKFALIISLPIAIVNMILQMLPFMVQRYNIPKLQILHRRNTLLQERAKEKELK